jgi:hypothetical protein
LWTENHQEKVNWPTSTGYAAHCIATAKLPSPPMQTTKSMHSSSLSCAGTSKAHSLPASSQPIPINIPMFYATHRISNVLYCSIIYHLESKNHTYVLHVIHICLKITYVYAYICLCLCHMHSCLFISIYMSYSYEFIVNIIIIIHVLASPRIWEQPQFIAMFSHSSHELWSSVMLYKVLGIGMKKHM